MTHQDIIFVLPPNDHTCGSWSA